MNYFELFDLPISFQINLQELKGKFYSLSRKYHPDFVAQENENEKNTALEISSQINKAYKTFQQPEETIKYVLHLKGLLEEEEKYQLSSDFLMDMMELNENVEEAKSNGVVETINKSKQSINDIEKEIYLPVKTIIEDYLDGVTTTADLLKVKEYYFKKKYLKRILATIE